MLAGRITIRMSVMPKPIGSRMPTMVAMAALTGLAVIANWEAVLATASGRSGRTMLANATA